jgi:glucose-1-phosphate adenylyltransferase
MSIMSQTLTIILAGGRDDRLSPIMSGKPKLLVPFGGAFSILDFTLSNCLNSDVERAYVLTKYKSSLITRYVESSSWKTELHCLAPRFSNAHRGTADALYQNLDLIRSSGIEYVLILTPDHIYKMNYTRLVRFHASHGGDATIAAVQHPRQSSSEAEVLEVDPQGQITGFQQKPDSSSTLATMGVYVLNASALHKALLRDAGSFDGHHDFEGDILPQVVRSNRVFAYDLTEHDSGLGGYCRSLSTIDEYHRAQMEILAMNSAFDPYQDARWPIYAGGRPAFSCVKSDPRHLILDSIISEDVETAGAAIIQSVISPAVKVAAGANIAGSIVMPGARVGRGAQIRRAIICEGVVIPEGERIGFDAADDRGRFLVTENGVTVVHSINVRRLQRENIPVHIARSA